jgi:hypothetical protein|tara:strand:- start:100 stop:537 length:438 start_codon:yes stop_codon:yes gene_type:complete
MFGIGDAVTAGLKIIDKFIPDPKAKADAIFKLKNLEQEGNMAQLNAYVTQLSGQIEINKIEAASTNLFKSGWRPFIGWVCGSAFAYKFIVQPFLLFLVALGQINIDISILPVLEWQELSAVLMGMLGLGSMRSFDRVKDKSPRGE